MIRVPTRETISLAYVVDVTGAPIRQNPEVYTFAIGELTCCDSVSMINEREWSVEVQRFWRVHDSVNRDGHYLVADAALQHRGIMPDEQNRFCLCEVSRSVHRPLTNANYI
jgi:hypothetical protein